MADMTMIDFQRPDGKKTPGHSIAPRTANAPGVVLIQEWWGLNDQIKGVAGRLASAGYRVLVPDLYRGEVAVEAKEAEHLASNLDFGDAAGQDIRGAVQHLKSAGGKVAVMGFCMGGALTILSAVNVPEADAVIAWYGYPALEYVTASRIKMPLQGHFAMHDAFFPIAGVDEMEKVLLEAGVRFEFHRYDARHAFGNETAVNSPIPIEYNRDAAELAWKRTYAFLSANL